MDSGEIQYSDCSEAAEKEIVEKIKKQQEENHHTGADGGKSKGAG